MARFRKQSFAQTCLKETDNGKLQQFNYSRSLITGVSLLENKEELQSVEIAIFIGQLQSDRAF